MESEKWMAQLTLSECRSKALDCAKSKSDLRKTKSRLCLRSAGFLVFDP
jgi:hypothetical protein